MDPNFKNDVRPEFISTVRQLQPIDVQVLHFALVRYMSSANYRSFADHHVVAEFKGQRATAIEISIANLVELGCLLRPSQALLSSYGFELLCACDPHNPDKRNATGS